MPQMHLLVLTVCAAIVYHQVESKDMKQKFTFGDEISAKKAFNADNKGQNSTDLLNTTGLSRNGTNEDTNSAELLNNSTRMLRNVTIEDTDTTELLNNSTGVLRNGTIEDTNSAKLLNDSTEVFKNGTIIDNSTIDWTVNKSSETLIYLLDTVISAFVIQHENNQGGVVNSGYCKDEQSGQNCVERDDTEFD